LENFVSCYPQKGDKPQTFPWNELDPSIKWRKYYQLQNGIKYKNLIPFSSVAKVVRGIATGDNEFFTFSKSKAEGYGIDLSSLLPCICKAVDAKSNFFTKANFDELVQTDRLAFLLNVTDSKTDNVKDYLEFGEKTGVNRRYLTSKRNPWYSLEHRPPSPIWVSVFNRRGLRFIRNEAGISNLTTFHCIYPIHSNLFNNINIDILFAYLLTNVARLIFEDNSREYGNGLQKFEPNDINKAMMLDLSLLSYETEDEVLRLYQLYRESVVAGLPDESFIGAIDEIFKSLYCQKETHDDTMTKNRKFCQHTFY
jgi:adenine-specific DNA-methyltransferase